MGHDGQGTWHLDKLVVTEAATGTTYFFPCGQWVKGSGIPGCMTHYLQPQAYPADPASLPQWYRVELQVEGVAGKLGRDSLRLELIGSRGESGVQRLDASRAGPGRPLACLFEALNVGQMERLRIGLAASEDGGCSALCCAMLAYSSAAPETSPCPATTCGQPATATETHCLPLTPPTCPTCPACRPEELAAAGAGCDHPPAVCGQRHLPLLQAAAAQHRLWRHRAGACRVTGGCEGGQAGGRAHGRAGGQLAG